MKLRSGGDYKGAQKKKRRQSATKQKLVPAQPTRAERRSQIRARIKRMNAIEVRRLDENDQRNEEEDGDRTITNLTKKMSDLLRKPDILKMEGNLSENWRRWKRTYDCYFDAAELSEKTDKIKINTFFNLIGPDAVDTFDSFNLPAIQSAVYQNVVKAFDDFCKPKQNTVYERFVFNERKQKEGEPFDTFHMDIKRLIRTCHYGDQENDMLRDRIVIGVYDKNLQKKLLETANLTYDVAVEKCRTAEVTKEQANEMSKLNAVNEVKHVVDNKNRKQRTNEYDRRKKSNNNNNKNTRNGNERTTGKRDDNRRSHTKTNNDNSNSRSNNNNNTNKSNKNSIIDNCKFCNLSHRLGSQHCTAFGKTCNTCGKRNHFSSVCKTVHVQHSLSATNYTSDEYEFDNDDFTVSSLDLMNTVETVDAISYPWIEMIEIEKEKIAFKVDTGASVDVMPLKIFKRVAPKNELRKTSITLRAFGGQVLQAIGTCSLFCRLNDIEFTMKFAVVDLDVTPILGLKSCIRFGLVKPVTNSQTQSSQ